MLVINPGGPPAARRMAAQLSYIPASGESASFNSATYGPLVVSQAALGPALPMLSGSWLAQPEMTAFQEGNLDPASATVAALAVALPNSSALGGAQLVTSLPSVLAGAASNLSVARSLLVISALELLFLAIAALLAAARLLATQREGETALLMARGATRSQLTRLTAAEVVPLAALVPIAAAAVAGAACAIALPRLVGTVINLSAFTHSAEAVPLGSDFASFLLPLAGLAAITVIALAYEVRRGRGVAVTMRT